MLQCFAECDLVRRDEAAAQLQRAHHFWAEGGNSLEDLSPALPSDSDAILAFTAGWRAQT